MTSWLLSSQWPVVDCTLLCTRRYYLRSRLTGYSIMFAVGCCVFHAYGCDMDVMCGWILSHIHIWAAKSRNSMTTWNVDFLNSCCSTKPQYALIILNQPFSLPLLQRVWFSSSWRSCADGGANQLYDLLTSHHVNPRLCVLSLTCSNLF